ncbi:hypothetical protein DITRI_Ditri05aG0151500 [Diplodiscus trichospermus]
MLQPNGMESANSNSSSKRLVFDRRYGWVFDEWKDPSEEALAAGRGMFCIVPLAKAFLKTASNSINFAAKSAVNVLQKPDVLSPRELHASLIDQLKRVSNSIQKPKSKSAIPMENPCHAGSCSSHLHVENEESQSA